MATALSRDSSLKPARSREPSLKPAKITKTLPDDQDITGFRMGKQRVVAKKKKKSALKKLIVAEREVRESLHTGDLQNGCHVAGNAQVSTGDALLDAPEYIPAWNFSAPDTDHPAEGVSTAENTATADTGALDLAGAANMTADSKACPRQWLRGQDKKQEKITGAAPEYLPSWMGGGADQGAGQAAAAPLGEEESERELLVSAAIEHLRGTDTGNRQKKKKEQPKQPAKTTANIEVRHYVHQVLSDELDEKVKAMLAELGRFQERARERDPLKFAKQKRFVVGMREASRSVTRGKARCLIMAPNLEASAAEGGLDDAVEDLMDLCREHEVPVVYALSRNRIGKALGKNIRLSIVCILSAEGVHQEFRQIIKMAEELRKRWVMSQMSSRSVEQVAQAVDPEYRSRGPSAAPSGIVSEAASDNEGAGDSNPALLAESISERVHRYLKEKQEEQERKREEERLARAEERAAMKEIKAKERAAKQAAKRAEQRAAKEEELREQLEAEEAERKAEEDRIRILAERDAARRAEIARRDKERAEREAKRKAEEEAKKAAASAQKAEEDDDDIDSDDSDLPIGFCADLL